MAYSKHEATPGNHLLYAQHTRSVNEAVNGRRNGRARRCPEDPPLRLSTKRPAPQPHTPRHGSLGRGALRRHEPLDHLHEVLRVAVLPQLRHGDVGLEQPLGELVGSQLEQRATAKGGRGLLVEAGDRVTLTALTA